jgi:hypothetical protein
VRVSTTNLTRVRAGGVLVLVPFLHPSVWGPFIAYPFLLPILLVPPALIAGSTLSLHRRRVRAQRASASFADWADRHLAPGPLLEEAHELREVAANARRVREVVRVEAWLGYLVERAARA